MRSRAVAGGRTGLRPSPAVRALRQGKIVSARRAAARLSAARRRGQRVVFTNGCFDLLHAGHVALLEKARSLGDLLVVGVNGDASVRRLKGPGRPVVPLGERMEVLAGLRAVDLVVPFFSLTPAGLIEALRPDVLVKGGDYRASEIVGAATVEAAGGRVVSLPLRRGRSTSELIRRAGRVAARLPPRRAAAGRGAPRRRGAPR